MSKSLLITKLEVRTVSYERSRSIYFYLYYLSDGLGKRFLTYVENKTSQLDIVIRYES